MSCGTIGPIRKAYCHDDVTKNPKRLVPSLTGFARVRVRKREDVGILKNDFFWRGF